MQISKSDWKLFQVKLPDWQEKFMDKINKEYIELLSSNDGNPSDRFWALDKRIKQDKRLPGVRLELEKGNVAIDIMHLIQDGAITIDDISEFSTELQDLVREYLERFS